MTYREDSSNRRQERGVSASELALFELGKVSIDGKPVRALAIRCGRCRKIETTKMNTFQGKSSAVATENKVATRRFEQVGWEVGDTPGRHRCPDCREKKPMKTKDTHLYEVSTPALATSPEVKPKVLGYENRRLIFDKLNDVYLDEKHGYSGDWTDKKVAENLGCPQAWVEEIREVNFGPLASNALIDEVLAKATKEVEECRTTAAKLLSKADELEKRLIDIRQMVRP